MNCVRLCSRVSQNEIFVLGGVGSDNMMCSVPELVVPLIHPAEGGASCVYVTCSSHNRNLKIRIAPHPTVSC
jgi:hypothetical protein